LPDVQDPQAQACAVIEDTLSQLGIEADRPRPGAFVVSLPGEHKLATTCALVVGTHTLSVNAFVARRPDEQHAEVYRVLLQRNVRLSGVAFALDRLGDIYLVGRLPLAAVDGPAIDHLLGAVVDAADSAFERILATGFATSIRREWQWRRSHGEPADNLEPFRALLDLDIEPDS
jgi:hypothetical protein